MTTDDRIVGLLEAILGELRRANRAAPSGLSRPDLSLLERLLPAIGGVLGSEAFLVRELLEQRSPALRAVVPPRLSARTLGRILRRARGVVVNGYVVSAVGTELGAVLWRVERAWVSDGDEPCRPLRGPDDSLDCARR